jgi:hypothetical protein
MMSIPHFMKIVQLHPKFEVGSYRQNSDHISMIFTLKKKCELKMVSMIKHGKNTVHSLDSNTAFDKNITSNT